MKHLFVIISLFLFAGIFVPPEENDLTANVATIDITPPLEMKYALGGYGERMNKPAEGIHDRIWAKAIVFKKGEKKYALVTLDVLGLPANVKTDLVKRISGKGWTKENLMLLPSHSHGSIEMAALNSRNLLNSPQIGVFHPELLEFILDKLETVIIDADQNFREIKIGTGSKQIDGLNRNRRKQPYVDKELIVTRIDLKHGEPLAVLVNWTAHPTFIDGSDMLVSAEWCGYLQTELKNKIGRNVTVMYYNGAEGDLSPICDKQINAYEKIQIYGKNIAEKAFEIYSVIETQKNNQFDFNYKTINLPEYKAHPTFMETGGAEYGLDENTVKIVMAMLGPRNVGLGSVKIGDLIIAGVPGEMTAELGLEVKKSIKKQGAKYVAIGGLANEWISYILSRDQYINGGGYESSVSFYGPGLGELITKEIINTSKELTN